MPVPEPLSPKRQDQRSDHQGSGDLNLSLWLDAKMGNAKPRKQNYEKEDKKGTQPARPPRERPPDGVYQASRILSPRLITH